MPCSLQDLVVVTINELWSQTCCLGTCDSLPFIGHGKCISYWGKGDLLMLVGVIPLKGNPISVPVQNLVLAPSELWRVRSLYIFTPCRLLDSWILFVGHIVVNSRWKKWKSKYISLGMQGIRSVSEKMIARPWHDQKLTWRAWFKACFDARFAWFLWVIITSKE